MDQADITPDNPRQVPRAQVEFPWDSYGTRHLYASISDIHGAGRGTFMRHQIGADAFLGWYTDPSSDYPDSDDVGSTTWDPVNLRPTCLAAFENGPLDSRLWSAEIRTVVNKVGMYTIGPIAKDGEVYAQHMELNTSRI